MRNVRARHRDAGQFLFCTKKTAEQVSLSRQSAFINVIDQLITSGIVFTQGNLSQHNDHFLDSLSALLLSMIL